MSKIFSDELSTMNYARIPCFFFKIGLFHVFIEKSGCIFCEEEMDAFTAVLLNP